MTVSAGGGGPNSYDVFNEYATPSTAPFTIVTGPDGNIWYVGAGSDDIVKVDPSTGAVIPPSPFSSPGCSPTGITIGPDRNLWVACFGDDQILRVTTDGAITNYPLPARATPAEPEFLTAGPDGFIWFTEVNTGYIGKLNGSTGSLYEYPLPGGANAHPRGIAVGSDGALWFTESKGDNIGRITTSGSITEYPLSASSGAWGITSGPDGNLYFTEAGADRVGRILLNGSISEFDIRSLSGPRMITVGPDGNLWFAEADADRIGSLTPDGGYQDIGGLSPGMSPFGVATGPDGNVWFTEAGQLSHNIGKLGARYGALTVDKTAVGFGNVLTGATTSSQRVTLTNNGPGPINVINAGILNGTGSGHFNIAGNTCTSLAMGTSCFVDVTFTAVAPGNAVSALGFTTSNDGTFLAPDKQGITVQLSATAVGPSCTSTAISTDKNSPQNVGATVTMSATSAGCPDANPLYRFWLRSPEGVWTIVRDFSTSASFVWNTSGYEPGTYLTGVWVKDASSQNTYDAYAFGTFTLSMPTCSSTNLSSDVQSPQTVGTTVTFTATSAGCPSPLYQWWVRDPAGNWRIAVPFAAGTTFAWNTSQLTEGTYQVGVWAKQQGSTASYDAFAFVTYTLTVGGAHCSVPTLAAAPPSPHATNSSITFTAGTNGACTSPQYRFWIRDLAGNWHIVQDFSSTSTFTWNSSSSPVNTSAPGTYLVGIWARATGSANTYDDFYFLTYTLTSAPACTVNIASAPGTGATTDTPVTWTATANGCSASPKFRFWVNPPGGTWAIQQDYSTSNTFSWTPRSPGTYQVGVWILQTGSTAAYDNFAFTTFSVLSSTPPTPTCTAASVTPAPLSPQTVGTSVTFTAGATGCASPKFQWWVRDTAANWAIVQPFSNGSGTFVWNTTGLPAGTYLVGVWARQVGSTASYEAYSFITYTLTVTRCGAVNITPSVASPQTVGTPVTFTATVPPGDCGAPNFRFFVAPPGGSFAEVQAYSATNTFAWNTAGKTPGPYQVGVWARQAGSTASYEAFAFITFQLQLTGSPCSTLTLWPAPTAAAANTIATQPPQPVGTQVVWNASAGGCTPVEYQFYVQAPWTSWFVVQPYSSSSTYNFNSAGLPAGIYRVLVLGRLAGSGSAYDVFAVSNYEVV